MSEFIYLSCLCRQGPRPWVLIDKEIRLGEEVTGALSVFDLPEKVFYKTHYYLELEYLHQFLYRIDDRVFISYWGAHDTQTVNSALTWGPDFLLGFRGCPTPFTVKTYSDLLIETFS
jgi:hypothetical protein